VLPNFKASQIFFFGYKKGKDYSNIIFFIQKMRHVVAVFVQPTAKPAGARDDRHFDLHAFQEP
jgi:hypothetical protein